ncbi:MAG: BatA domain-containing protein, partial [Planctomycetota bacterium]
MTFFEPLLLALLPLAALPVLIHLLNQRRFQNVDWGAMRFLLEANRMSRGFARIRQWLILLFRVLAVAAIVFVLSRPLATGWMGLAGGGRVDTTLILLDRSPSMGQTAGGGAASKLDSGVRQLAQALGKLGSSRWVLIDSVTLTPQELQSPRSLVDSPRVATADASADLPALLQAAHDYVKSNRAGQTEIWICSDLRANDWDAKSQRWRSLRAAFAKFKQGVRFHLLAYPDADRRDAALRVADVERRATDDGAELLLSLRITRSAGDADQVKIPVSFEIDGARSEVEVELQGAEVELRGHAIALDERREAGWGRVSLPADLNPLNNDFYFAFGETPPRRAVLVVEDRRAARPLRLAAAISADPSVACEADFVDRGNLKTVAWEETALLVWQATLPDEEEVEMVDQFVARGGQVVFFPPKSPADRTYREASWGDWTGANDALRVESWRGDDDLLERTLSGAALPVGELNIRRHCQLEGPLTPLATLAGGDPLLARATTDRGGVYFCSTTVEAGDSSLAMGGVTLYAALQRALESGAERLAAARQTVAGKPLPSEVDPWRRLAGDES